MPSFRLQFEMKIKGQIEVGAENAEEAAFQLEHEDPLYLMINSNIKKGSIEVDDIHPLDRNQSGKFEIKGDYF